MWPRENTENNVQLSKSTVKERRFDTTKMKMSKNSENLNGIWT